MKSKALSHSNSVIIIQVYSKIPRATWKVLKNAKCTWSLRDCICSNFYLTTHLLASLKRKTDSISTILWRITTAERARAVVMLQQHVSIKLLVCIGHRSFNTGVRNAWRPENDEFSFVYRKLRYYSAGDLDLYRFRGKRLTYRIPTPYRSRLLLLFL